MKFLPTVNVWDAAVSAALRAGQLKLQCGQWVRCGIDGAPARWVGQRKGGSMWVAHSEGDKKTTRSFPRLCAAAGKGS